MNREQFRAFSLATTKATSEEDVDKLIRLLTERNQELSFDGSDVREITADEWQECLDRERRLHSRLMEEKKKVLAEMEALSQTRQAAQRYRPRFPFPMMPVFFDIKA